MKHLTFIHLVFGMLLITGTSCNDKLQTLSEQNLSPIGLRQVSTNIGGAEVYDLFVDMLEENEDIKIIAKIDHSANAESVEMTLPLTRVILFGNPNLGTPLMQESLTAGIDLPQKLLITEAIDGKVTIAYNDISYLANRHGLENAAALSKVENALVNIVKNITEYNPILNNNVSVGFTEGLVIKESKNNFDDTYEKIKSKIENNQKLSLIAELDHKSNAATVDLELDNCKLIVFGNPELGSPLMMKKAEIGIDLPQKILVFQDGDNVKVAFNDPNYLTNRFHIDNVSGITSKINTALNNITETAINF